jgi:hypothetical protein
MTLLLVPVYTFALDLKVSGGLGNNVFSPGARAPLGEGQFSPSYFPLALVDLRGNFSNMIGFAVTFERDPILRNRINAGVGIDTDYLHLDIGPFIGVFNAAEKPLNPGITAALGLKIPGIIFGSVTAASTIGNSLVKPGDYTQEWGEVSLGTWIPYVLGAVTINMSGFTERISMDLIRKDERVRYQLDADVFAKNVPYAIYIDMGYQTLKRMYIGADQIQTDELRSIYVGFEAVFTISPVFSILAGLEMPAYTWGAPPLKGPPINTPLFQTHAGVVISFPERDLLP